MTSEGFQDCVVPMRGAAEYRKIPKAVEVGKGGTVGICLSSQFKTRILFWPYASEIREIWLV